MAFLRFILLLLVSLSIFLLVTFVNVKMLFSSPDRAKTFLSDSNIYPVAAAGIRDNIVKYAEVPVDQGKLIEIVNSAVSEADLKIFVEDFTDQFFNVIKGKDKDKKITIHFASLKDKVINQIGGDKEYKALIKENDFLNDRDVDLSKNTFVSILIHINDYVIGFGIATLILILLLLLSGTWAQKLVWLGATFIVSAITFFGELIIYYFGITQKAIEAIAKETNFKDEKFLLGVQKLITSMMDYQKVYYTSVTVGLLILGIALIIIGKSLKKPNVNMEKI